MGSEGVTRTLHDHFLAQFASEGGHWHEDKEVDRAMRALFSDSHAGAKVREEILVSGAWPPSLGPMLSPAARKGRERLMAMCQLKAGAEHIDHEDYLNEITPEEWKAYWNKKGRRTWTRGPLSSSCMWTEGTRIGYERDGRY